MINEINIVFCQLAGKKKIKNQDALFNGVEVCQMNICQSKLLNLHITPEQTIKLGVADGVYNSPNSQLASKYWLQAFKDDNNNDFKFLRTKYYDFCNKLCKKNYGSSTTFAGVIIDSRSNCSIANIGDSRIYYIAANTDKWVQLSYDHTILNDMIEEGLIKIDQKKEYASIYNSLTQYLIADPVEYDYKIFTKKILLNSNDTIVICSDGLTDSLSISKIENIWKKNQILLNKVEALKNAVSKINQHDDLSIVACYIK